MKRYKIVAILGPDVFRVEPKWRWNKRIGDRIKINNISEIRDDLLSDVVVERWVELKKTLRIVSGRLLCDADLYYGRR